jgi:hypothetical protein
LERTPQQCQPPRTGWWVSSQPFEFLTKATWVSSLWFVPTSSLSFSDLTFCPSFEESCSRERLLGQGIFFPSRPIPVESSMSVFCILVIC